MLIFLHFSLIFYIKGIHLDLNWCIIPRSKMFLKSNKSGSSYNSFNVEKVPLITYNKSPSRSLFFFLLAIISKGNLIEWLDHRSLKRIFDSSSLYDFEHIILGLCSSKLNNIDQRKKTKYFFHFNLLIFEQNFSVFLCIKKKIEKKKNLSSSNK